jgi:predicted amidohydrolase
MIRVSADSNASLAVLPEMFYHPYELSEILKKTGTEDEILDRFCQCARETGMYICTGSMAVRSNGKVYNRSYLIDPEGKPVLTYDKCHLFDVQFKQLKAHESLFFARGDSVAVVDTAIAKIGIVVCYDIRFPELVRCVALAGAEVLLVPAVFNTITGPVHWHVMMKARAIENQFFLAAVSQGRNSETSYQAYGHSMVVSPWGDVMVEAGEGEGIVYAELDPEVIENTRKSLPLYKHRREGLYSTLMDSLQRD